MILFCFNIILTNKMTQYKILKVKSSNSRLNKLKSEIKMELKELSIFQQVILTILMAKLLFHINFY